MAMVQQPNSCAEREVNISAFHLLPPSVAYMFSIAQVLAQDHFVFGETTEIPGARTKLVLVLAVPKDNRVF